MINNYPNDVSCRMVVIGFQAGAKMGEADGEILEHYVISGMRGKVGFIAGP